MKPVPHVMTVAGSDSGGGAGVQADLKTFAALETYGTSAITALTAQNTQGVQGVHAVPVEFVAAQIDAIVEDIGAHAAKTGMLASREIVEVVAQRLKAHQIHELVVDPVMVATSGDPLLEADAVHAIKARLIPLAQVVTPNLAEAAILSGLELSGPTPPRDRVLEAGQRISDLGASWVLIKGGHLAGEAVDFLFHEGDVTELEAPRVETPNTHGTGCTLSAAIAANLAHGQSPPDAVAAAKEYLTEALRQSYSVGSGHSPVHHFHRWWR
jgi:hydroxymethylpyrimidine/phosphomethylpyrimidine kinase